MSDYVFGHLQEFISDVNARALESRVARRARYRSLILEPARPPRWGSTRWVSGVPYGAHEQADIVDELGSVATSVSVYRSRIGDRGAEVVYVPEPRSVTKFSLRVSGQPPHSYAAPLTVPKFLQR